MNFKVDDEYFKDKIDYNNLEDNIYSQFAKTMAKNVDIDLAKTPLVDILTGYTRYRILQSKIDKANEYLESRFIFDDENGEYYQTHTFDKCNVKELHDILKEDK